MYIATREINTSKQTYQAGQEVPNPSTRMIEVGAVRKVPSASAIDIASTNIAPGQGTVTTKDKKDKAQTVKEPVKEPVKETVKETVKEPVKETVKEPVKEPQEEILTEDSSDVVVKTEE